MDATRDGGDSDAGHSRDQHRPATVVDGSPAGGSSHTIANVASSSDASKNDGEADASVWEEYEYEAGADGTDGGAHSGVYYYNHTTGVSQYEEPECLKGIPHQLYHPPDGPAWHAYVDDSGFVYYYNHATQASQYGEPSEDYIPLRVAYSAAAATGHAAGEAAPSGSGHARDRGDEAAAVDIGANVDTAGRSRRRKSRSSKSHSKKKRRHRRREERDGRSTDTVQPKPVTTGGAQSHDGAANGRATGLEVAADLRDELASKAMPGEAAAADGISLDGSDTDDSDSSSSDSSVGHAPDAWLPGLGPDAPPERVFRAFRWQSICHAVACEAPALVCESIARAALMLIGSAVLAVLAAARVRERPARLRLAACWLREAVIFAFSVPSFVVPGVLAFSVYQQLDSSGDDWDMSPLWTLIGDIDPRRFWIIRRGNGSYARNVRGIVFQPSEYTMDGVWGRHLGTPAGHTAVAGSRTRGGGQSGDDSGDEEFGLPSDDEAAHAQVVAARLERRSSKRSSRTLSRHAPSNGNGTRPPSSARGVRNGNGVKHGGVANDLDPGTLGAGLADLSVIDIGGQSFSMSMASIDPGVADSDE